MTSAGVLLVCVGLAAFGWELAADPARAAFVLHGLLCFAALAMLARDRAQPLLAAVAAVGAGLQAASIGCGLWYDSLVSQTVGVCDEGTGRPVRAGLGVAVLFFAAWFLRACRGDRR